MCGYAGPVHHLNASINTYQHQLTMHEPSPLCFCSAAMAEQLKDTVDKVADKLQGASMQQSPDAPIGAFPEEPQTEQVGTTEPDVDMGESKAVEGEAEAEDTPKIFMVQ